jgi:hypothetical protein
MNDVLSIIVAAIFLCIILDALGYLLKLIGILAKNTVKAIKTSFIFL